MAFTAKSVIIDIADNRDYLYYIMLRSIDFYFENSLVTVTPSVSTSYATTEADSFYHAENVFGIYYSKTGDSSNTSWKSISGNYTNQRLICVFDSSITFDEIRVNNHHSYGNQTERGAKNVKIYYSTSEITNTTYGDDTGSYTEIFDGVFSEHVSSDVEDTETLTLSGPAESPTADEILTGNPVLGTPELSSTFGSVDEIISSQPVLSEPTAATMDISGTNPVLDTPIASITTAPVPRVIKSIIIDIADNYGDIFSMGLRSVDFYLNEVKTTLTYFDITGYATSYDSSNFTPSNVFETAKPKTGAADNSSWKADDEKTDQRLVCVFDSAITFDAIKVNNFHSSGGDTDKGAQNVKVYTSSYDVTNTVYDDITEDYLLIYDGTFDQHSEADEEDSQELILLPPPLDIRTLSPDVPAINGYYLVGVADIVTPAPSVATPTATFLTGVDSIASGEPVLDIPNSPAIGQFVLDLRIPIDLEIYNGNNLTSALPSFEFSADLFSGRIGALDITLPKLTSVGYFGSEVTSTIPVLELSCELSKDEIGNISGQLPALQGTFNVLMTTDFDFIASLKPLQLAITTLVGSTNDLSITLPKIVLNNTLLTGNVGNLLMTLAAIQGELSSIITGDNDLELTFPKLSLILDGDKLNCFILAYDKGKVR